MARYSVHPRDRIFLKLISWKYLYFAKNMGKNMDKNISKNLSRKYSRKFSIILNNLPQMGLKLLQKEQSKK